MRCSFSTGPALYASKQGYREAAMAADEGRTRYILTLLVQGGWPNESLVPSPDEIQRELRATFDKPITIQASQTGQNPGANTQRYYELQADRALSPSEIRDMLVVVIERIGAGMFSSLEIGVLLATSTGADVARGTARPQPR
jgi:hypothetical protein